MLDSDEEINQAEKKSKPCSKKGSTAAKKLAAQAKAKNASKSKGDATAKAKASAKAKTGKRAQGLNKAEGDKEAGENKTMLDSYLGKTWLAFKDEQLQSLSETNPEMKYQEKLKIISNRWVSLNPRP